MRPLVAHMSAAALQHNYSLFPANTWVVVKANGYGFGAADVARRLPNAPGFAVACLEEAISLREEGITQPILLLEGPFEPAEWYEIGAYQLDAVVHRADQLEWINTLRTRSWAGIWLKIDTGMHRLGMTSTEARGLVAQVNQMAVKRRVWMAHFACADDVQSELPITQAPDGWALSLSNSAAGLAHRQLPDNWSRAGIALYGGSPIREKIANALGLRPVQSLRSKVVAIRSVPRGESVGYGARWTASRDSVIATIPGGYADGYLRSVPDGTPVSVAGGPVPLAGCVSMDRITVDITQRPDIEVGAEAELWGDQISVDEVAQKAGTIAYELFCNLAPRVARVWSEK